MVRSSDLVKAALQRLDHVGALFGPIEILISVSPPFPGGGGGGGRSSPAADSGARQNAARAFGHLT
jgi:hypothetical protein